MAQKSKQQQKHTVGVITDRCIWYCKKKQPLCTNNRKDITLALLPDMLCAMASSPYPNTTILQREITHLRPEQYRLKKNHCFSINRCLLSLFLRSLLLSALVFLGCCLSSAGLFSVARIGLRERSEDGTVKSNSDIVLGRLVWLVSSEKLRADVAHEGSNNGSERVPDLRVKLVLTWDERRATLGSFGNQVLFLTESFSIK